METAKQPDHDRHDFIDIRDLQAILAKYPNFSADGFGGPPRYAQDGHRRNFNLYEVCLAMRWIADCTPTKTFSGRSSSYSLKHVMERQTGDYVTSGEFLLAALLMGYRANSANCWDPILNLKPPKVWPILCGPPRPKRVSERKWFQAYRDAARAGNPDPVGAANLLNIAVEPCDTRREWERQQARERAILESRDHSLHDFVSIDELKAILIKYPQLTFDGFGRHRSQPPYPHEHRFSLYRVCLGMRWVAACARTETFRGCGSVSELKHDMQGQTGEYVSNGEFLLASLLMGCRPDSTKSEWPRLNIKPPSTWPPLCGPPAPKKKSKAALVDAQLKAERAAQVAAWDAAYPFNN